MKPSTREQGEGKLSQEQLAQALETLRTDGYVVLEGVIPKRLAEEIRIACIPVLKRYVEENEKVLDPSRIGHGISGMQPLWEMPFMDPQVIANPVVLQVVEGALGEDFFLSFYNTNNSWPGSGTQRVHRDSHPLFEDFPHPLPVCSLVVNIPLVDFTGETGATELWPGTHLYTGSCPGGENNFDALAAGKPSMRMAMPVGALAVRDMRMWHRGMPNRTENVRTMLAVMYNRRFSRSDNRMDIPRQVWEQLPEDAHQVLRHHAPTPR